MNMISETFCTPYLECLCQSSHLQGASVQKARKIGNQLDHKELRQVSRHPHHTHYLKESTVWTGIWHFFPPAPTLSKEQRVKTGCLKKQIYNRVTTRKSCTVTTEQKCKFANAWAAYSIQQRSLDLQVIKINELL